MSVRGAWRVARATASLDRVPEYPVLYLSPPTQKLSQCRMHREAIYSFEFEQS